MGRRPKVEKEKIISLISKYIKHFETNNFPPKSSPVWEDLSKDVNYQWKAHSWYTHVRDNKQGNLDAARKLCGICTSPPVPTKIKHDDTVPELFTPDSSLAEDDSPFEPEEHDLDQHDFHLLLTTVEWDLIKPDDLSEPGEKRLKPRVWPSTISNSFFLRYNMPCAMIAKWSRVCIGEDGSFRVTFKTICKSKKCGNIFFGTADKNPGSGNLHLNIRARDMRGKKHEVVKRPLNGFERVEVGQKLVKQRPDNYRRKLLREEMDFGESVPPNIREGYVYRQAKMEATKRLYGILPGDKRDQLTILRDLSVDPQYTHTILDIGLNPFHLIYCTPEQVYVFKEYNRVVKNSRIMADATGSLVKKFEKAPGCLTGHIFLYVITISFEQKTVPVYQVLTERQDANFLVFWLGTWMRKFTISPPRQAISDQERALMMAHCQVFNGRTIKQYVDDVFVLACDEATKKTKAFPAATVIRIDVAHLMSAAARWDCFKDPHKFRAKRFYVRTIALLVDCQSVREFQLVFLLTGLVALMPVNDYVIELPDATEPVTNCKIKVGESRITADQARTKLEDYISLRGPIIDNLHEYSENDDLEITLNIEALPEETSRESKVTVAHQWINKLISLVKPEKPESIPGNVENGLYFPPIVRELERIGKEFPLWTSAALPTAIVPCHASTASQEGYFNEVKNRIFDGVILLVSCHRVLRDHLQDISSGDKEMGAKLKEFVHRAPDEPPTSSFQASQSEECQQKTTGGDEQVNPGPKKSGENKKVNAEPKKNGGNEPINPKPKKNGGNEIVNSEPKKSGENKNVNPEPKKNGVDETLNPELNAGNETANPGQKKNGGNEQVNPQEVVLDNSDIDVDGKSSGFYRDDNKENVTVSPASEKRFLDDSDYHSQMQWRGIINDKNKVLWQRGDAVVEELLPESPGRNFNTQDICSDILGMESDDLLGLVEGELFDDTYKDDNNNKQSSVHVNQKSNDSDLVENESSVPLQKSPQFSSTLTDNHEHVLSQNTDSILIDKTNINSREGIGSSKQLGKVRRKKKPTGYFAPYPQIKIINQKGTTIGKTGNFLPNGLHCPVVKQKGMGIFVTNTCGLDSFVHIFQYAALDHDTYRHTVESSKNALFKFVVEFMKHGNTTINLQRRCALLAEHYPLQTQKNSTTISPYILNAKDTLVNIWGHFFGEPVASRRTECSNIYCSIGKSTNVPYLIVDYEPICKRGFGDLENAIEIWYTKDCKKFGCGGEIEVTLECKETVFIELDVMDVKQNTKVGCRLHDIPVHLNFGKMSRLVGIIHFRVGDKHFVAYCRRIQGDWLECDDLKLRSFPAAHDTRVLPFGAIYVRA